MKKFDIDVRFTEKVSEYLMKGYTIHADSMGGHQGEVAKVDLVKDNTLIRIYLEDESNYFFNDDDSSKWSGRSRVLRVGKWSNPASHASDCWDTVWMSHLEILEEIIFYQIDDRSRTPWYVEDLGEALACQGLSWSRRRRHMTKHIVKQVLESEAHKDVAVNYLKRKLGYQRVSRDHVSIITNENHKFYVDYRGEKYLLK